MHKHWLLATKKLWWARAVAMPSSHGDMVFETYDGVPQRDLLSTLVFATSMTLLKGHHSQQGSECVAWYVRR